MTTAEQIREAIQEAWKTSGLSKAGLSRKIGKNKNYLNDVFSGRITPSADVLDAIAEATGREVDFRMPEKEKRLSVLLPPGEESYYQKRLIDLVTGRYNDYVTTNEILIAMRDFVNANKGKEFSTTLENGVLEIYAR